MKTQFTSRIDDDLMDKIKAIANKEMRSINNTIEFLLSKGVGSYMREADELKEIFDAPDDAKA